MTEQGSGGSFEPGWRRLRPYYAWLGRSVSFATIIAVLVVVGVAVAVFVASGGVSVSADKPDGWLAEHLLHFVFKRSESSRSIDVAPPDDFAAPSRVRLAAQHFDMVCANCHGRPGFGQSVIALSMSPRPQYLPKVVGQFTDAELYMIVDHGVKFSAMPSWPTDRREDEVWSMVAFLRQLPKLDAKTYHELTALPDAGAGAPRGAGDDTTLRPADAYRNMAPLDEFLYAAPAAGFSDQSVHDAAIPTCARCHGLDGTGAATGGEAPNLTIQDEGYLQAALEAYTRGSRKSGYMQNIAAQLSGPQIAAVAHYYAGLRVQAPSSPPADPALVARGETIATQGLPQSALPACSTCHESAGAAISGAPHIAGQSATYLRRELTVLRRGRGSTVPWNPMTSVAHVLSDQDIAALAAYYASLPPARASAGASSASTLQATPPSPASPADIAAAKAIFAANCSKCHGSGGRGDRQGDYPDLTLQDTAYVSQSLYAYHAGVRPDEQMSQATLGLTFDDMRNLARYVNGMAPQSGLVRPDAAAAARGEAIATRGVPARGVPACLDCHGAKGVAALSLIPALQGQNPLYLRNKLKNYAEPYAQNLTKLNPMPAIASRLTDQERFDLSAYFAAAAPLQKPQAQP